MLTTAAADENDSSELNFDVSIPQPWVLAFAISVNNPLKFSSVTLKAVLYDCYDEPYDREGMVDLEVDQTKLAQLTRAIVWKASW